jgi:hypothetical protein
VLVRIVTVVASLLASAWCFGAVWFDGPFDASLGNSVLAFVWALSVVAVIVVLKRGLRRASLVLVLLAVVYVPWSQIRASNDRDWAVYWSQLATIEVDGERFTFNNFRDFRHTSTGVSEERWTTKTVSLSNLQAVDIFIDRFGGELLAHPMLSFDFGPDGRVALSIETRRESDESFSALGGLFKVFELQYIFGSEDDFIPQRTVYYGNPVFVYRLSMPKERAYALFLNSVTAANDLAKNPRYYDVISANCTTSYWQQGPARGRQSTDYRVLLNGGLDHMFFEAGTLVDGGLDYWELREQAFINGVIDALPEGVTLSEAIRAGRVGFQSIPSEGAPESTDVEDGATDE